MEFVTTLNEEINNSNSIIVKNIAIPISKFFVEMPFFERKSSFEKPDLIFLIKIRYEKTENKNESSIATLPKTSVLLKRFNIKMYDAMTLVIK